MEREISRWNGFAKVLRKEDKEAFDEVMNTYRCLASENTDPSSHSAFEQMVLSITTGQMATLNRIEAKLNQLDPPKPEPRPEKVKRHPTEPMIAWHKPPPKKAQRGLNDFG